MDEASKVEVPAATRPSDGSWLKETVAALIALAIVGCTLSVMHAMFGGGAKIEDGRWQQLSSILQVAVGLAGTVTGYYFGRIPAEKAAQQAAQARDQSAAAAQTAASNEARIRGQVDQLKRRFGTPIGGAPMGGGGNPAEEAEAMRRRIADELEHIG